MLWFAVDIIQLAVEVFLGLHSFPEHRIASLIVIAVISSNTKTASKSSFNRATRSRVDERLIS